MSDQQMKRSTKCFLVALLTAAVAGTQWAIWSLAGHRWTSAGAGILCLGAALFNVHVGMGWRRLGQ